MFLFRDYIQRYKLWTEARPVVYGILLGQKEDQSLESWKSWGRGLEGVTLSEKGVVGGKKGRDWSISVRKERAGEGGQGQICSIRKPAGKKDKERKIRTWKWNKMLFG